MYKVKAAFILLFDGQLNYLMHNFRFARSQLDTACLSSKAVSTLVLLPRLVSLFRCHRQLMDAICAFEYLFVQGRGSL